MATELRKERRGRGFSNGAVHEQARRDRCNAAAGEGSRATVARLSAKKLKRGVSCKRAAHGEGGRGVYGDHVVHDPVRGKCGIGAALKMGGWCAAIGCTRPGGGETRQQRCAIGRGVGGRERGHTQPDEGGSLATGLREKTSGSGRQRNLAGVMGQVVKRVLGPRDIIGTGSRILIQKLDVKGALQQVGVDPGKAANFCYGRRGCLFIYLRLQFGWLGRPGR